jgi:hypothetical protein
MSAGTPGKMNHHDNVIVVGEAPSNNQPNGKIPQNEQPKPVHYAHPVGGSGSN